MHLTAVFFVPKVFEVMQLHPAAYEPCRTPDNNHRVNFSSSDES